MEPAPIPPTTHANAIDIRNEKMEKETLRNEGWKGKKFGKKEEEAIGGF